IYMSNYTTQLIFAIWGILFVLIIGSKMKKLYKIIIILPICLLIIIGLPMLPTIIESISRTFFAKNETVNVRLNEIVLLLRRESIKGSDLMGRFDLIKLSWDSFKNNPLLGVPFSRYNTMFSGLIVGGHSEWPDDLARYGIIGGAFFTLFVVRSLKKVLLYERNNCYSLKYAFSVVIILYGFSNPIIRYIEYEFFFFIMLFVDYNISFYGGDNC
ncbi:MAG: O-antigen ligase family protein, partial [Lachnospiraceae bacterium]|nr:O-antigen ligase family protein [Lachnospiraceae bacterium]